MTEFRVGDPPSFGWMRRPSLLAESAGMECYETPSGEEVFLHPNDGHQLIEVDAAYAEIILTSIRIPRAT